MRLLQVIATIDPGSGGPIEGLRQIVRAIQDMEAGIENTIVSLDAPDAFALAAETSPCPVIRLGCPKVGKYGYTPRFREWLETHVNDYNAVIIHGLWQYHGFATARVCHSHAVPYFVYAHGMLDPWFNLTYPLKKIKKRLYWTIGEHPVLSGATSVLFTCEEERVRARRSFSPYRVNEKVIGYGTTAPAETISTLRARFQAHPPEWATRPFFLYLGRIQKKKGLDLLLRAYSHLRESKSEMPDLVIAGPVHQKAYANHLKKNFSREGIHWAGTLEGESKWQALAAAEALVLVSHQENFALVVVEALAVGTPVLISDKINIWREITEGDVGFVETDTVEGAGRLLNRWLEIPEKMRLEMAGNAPRVFEDHFEVSQVAERLIEHIRLATSTQAVDNE